uniref:Reverse transcriptase domain-containing protein n=1 Tax=Tanacetum cinerariifolium TaxID=118510 RepID=A0A6L2KD01_TANCI|nr:hypothetical protein [Tanacetum cinerariifolium]
MFDSGLEDLSMPYRRPNPMPFTSRITHFRYHRWAKLPPNVRVYEGKKDPEDHLSIFFYRNRARRVAYAGLQAFMDRFKADCTHIKGVPLVLRIFAFMHGHGHPELTKKLNDKIPKTVDEMWKRVRAFIRGETAADTTEVIRSPQKSFTPLTKTPKEILDMDNVNFPPPPLMVGNLEKQNMNKFCDYHQDRGHNTNDCYHLKKQIEEAVASRRLAHLVKNIRKSGQKIKGSTKGKEKVINMTRSRLRESRNLLVGFSREVNYPLGVIDLEVTIGEYRRTRIVIMKFVVVKSMSSYNALLGRTEMRSLGAVASTINSMIKFPTSNGIANITTTRETLRECRQFEEAQALSWNARITDPSPMQTSSKVINPRERRKPDKGKKLTKSTVEEKIVVNGNYPEQLVTIRGVDMTGISWAIMEHSIDTYPYIKPKVQKKRSLALDRRKVDLCPLPEIDWKIESMMGFWYKCFLDTYKGYHQIQMTTKDEENTTFHTKEGVFCYMKMPFGLKNARATYQRLVDSAFKEQIGVNLEAHVDDMVIKSKTEQDIIKYIEQTFTTLRRINMKLNPKKCSFDMEEGKFFRHIVTLEGIMANPEKTKAVIDMPSPRILKQMQSLSGKVAALNRFLSKSTEQSLHSLDTLNKCTNKKDFRWTEAAEAAFLEMKKLVSKLSTLTTTKKGETLMMYLVVANDLLTERDGRQMHIHYVIQSLQGAETNYAPMEKLALALVHAARWLRRYFQAYPIKVKTDSPIGQVMNKSRASRRLAKWAVELGAYGITYVSRVAVKGQVLANFLANTSTEINATPKVANTPRVEDIPESSSARENITPGPMAWSYTPMEHQTIEENMKADALSKLAPVQFDHLSKEVLVKVFNERSVKAKEDNMENIIVERANKSLLRGIKTRLEKGGPAWAEEVPNVLWAHQTMNKTSMDLCLNLDLLEERKEMAAIREARYKQQVEKYYNKNMRHVQFKVGKFVLRKNEASRAANTGKMRPTWEGPYKVIQAFQSEAYKLSNIQ